MVDFVKRKEDFEKYKYRFNTLFKQGIRFEDNPFNECFKHFVAFEFDFIYHESFFKGIKNFLSEKGVGTVIFYTIDPSPEEYFYHHFEKYSVFEISSNATDEELSKIMMKNPGDSPADALAINSNEISWFSPSDDWAIIGSRDWEIGLIGFIDQTTKELFLNSFSESVDMFFPIQQQVEIYQGMFEFTEVRKKIYDKLIKNYQERE